MWREVCRAVSGFRGLVPCRRQSKGPGSSPVLQCPPPPRAGAPHTGATLSDSSHATDVRKHRPAQSPTSQPDLSRRAVGPACGRREVMRSRDFLPSYYIGKISFSPTADRTFLWTSQLCQDDSELLPKCKTQAVPFITGHL